MPLAVFRCDATPAIGGGHVMRCLTLAEMLRDLGWHCGFATVPATLTSLPALPASGHDVIQLPDPADPAALFHRWPAADLAVIDHYDFDRTYEAQLRPWARRILAIDDVPGRPHAADLLLDQTLGRRASEHKTSHAGPALLGADFALLRPAFRAARPAALARRDGRPVERILIAFGAVDAGNATLTAIQAATTALPQAALDIVLGAAAPHLAGIRALADQLPQAQIHVDVSDMAALMVNADLAIGAPGTSAWERCALGLPTLLLLVAENQRDNAASLAAAGAAHSLGWHDAGHPQDLAKAIGDLAADHDGRRAMAAKAAAICDGLGALRVALALLQAEQARDAKPVLLRAARAADAAMLLDWQRDPATRRFARNPAIPTETEHQAWLQHKLGDPDCLFAIIEHAGSSAGLIRLDRRPGKPPAYEISIVTAPGMRGLGIAPAALRLARQLAPGCELVAEVLPDNIASTKLFTAAGYKRMADGLFHAHPAID